MSDSRKGRDNHKRRPSGRPDGPRRGSDDSRGKITVTKGGRLPAWVRDEILRSTPKERRDPAIARLEQGLAAFVDDKFPQAVRFLREAKDLAPRSATIRELLGLSLYENRKWDEALRELRTFRRLTGETSLLAVEMDCLRALGRPDQVHKTWEIFNERGAAPVAEDEIRVVYASFLLDERDTAAAWQVIKPGRLVANPPESALRRWAVAARVAMASGDRSSAEKLLQAIRDTDPDLPWLEDLEAQLA